jgi:hypothetical protein
MRHERHCLGIRFVILRETLIGEICVEVCELYLLYRYNYMDKISVCGPGSSVGIATGYGLDGPGIASRWGEIFRNCADRPWGPSSLLYNGYRVFPGGRNRPGRDADTFLDCRRRQSKNV